MPEHLAHQPPYPARMSPEALLTGVGIGVILTSLCWLRATIMQNRRYAALAATRPLWEVETVTTLPSTANPDDRVTVFKDESAQWRWHMQAANGEIIATSGEGYVHLDHAVKMAERVTGRIPMVLA